LRISDTTRGAEDAQELIALPADTAEQTNLLKNHGPGNNGKKKKQSQNTARNPAGVGENASQIDQKNTSNQKNTSSPHL
jgi:hypothetical protein